jgi:spore maturation protein CgeB
MKVLISGSFWNGSLEESYVRAFEQLGITVVRFDWEQIAGAHPLASMRFTNKLLRSRIADRAGKWLVTAVEDSRPDLVLVVKGRSIRPEVIEKIGSLPHTPTIVNFNPDSPWEPHNSSRQLLEAIPQYHAHFTWSTKLIAPFASAGSRMTHFLPFAYDPVLHYPISETGDREFDAVFIGTYDDERDALLSNLSGFKIGIWGNGWGSARHVPKEWIKGRAIYGEEATRILSQSASALNILRPQNRGSHNMRTFEIPATSHAMIASRSDMHAQWFTENESAMYFDAADELREKIDLLRHDRDRANTIARNGYDRVKEETYARRAAMMLSLLGLQK